MQNFLQKKMPSVRRPIHSDEKIRKNVEAFIREYDDFCDTYYVYPDKKYRKKLELYKHACILRQKILNILIRNQLTNYNVQIIPPPETPDRFTFARLEVTIPE